MVCVTSSSPQLRYVSEIPRDAFQRSRGQHFGYDRHHIALWLKRCTGPATFAVYCCALACAGDSTRPRRGPCRLRHGPRRNENKKRAINVAARRRVRKCSPTVALTRLGKTRITGRWRRPSRQSISKMIGSPGSPSTLTCGFAHGEPRGHFLRGSRRGCSLAPGREQCTSFGVLPSSVQSQEHDSRPPLANLCRLGNTCRVRSAYGFCWSYGTPHPLSDPADNSQTT